VQAADTSLGLKRVFSRTLRIVVTVAVVALALPLGVAYGQTSSRATVTSVVDGDTLHARLASDGRDVAVRLIGIDTPETRRPGTPIECGGPEASECDLR
jgi:micrococcal nuclease